MLSRMLVVAVLLASTAPCLAQSNKPVQGNNTSPRNEVAERRAAIASRERQLAYRQEQLDRMNSEAMGGEGPRTANPAAYRAWLRQKIAQDLATLDRLTREIAPLLASTDPRAARRAEKYAGKIARLSHNTWNNLQLGRPTREDPKFVAAPPRPLDATRADATSARQLLDEVARLLVEQDRSPSLDIERRIVTLEKLEHLEALARQIREDARARR